jgi:hypothetical protein
VAYQRRRFVNVFAQAVMVGCTVAVLIPLVLIFSYLLLKGFGSLNWAFFTNLLKGDASNLLAFGTNGRPLPLDFNTKTIDFEASDVKPAAGHQIVQYSWNFGDGTTASGVQTTHVFAAAATYQVVLTVTDDAAQRSTPTHGVTINSGNPIPSFTSSVANAATHTMFFDGGGSTAWVPRRTRRINGRSVTD